MIHDYTNITGHGAGWGGGDVTDGKSEWKEIVI